jgi:hypothetical protein
MKRVLLIRQAPAHTTVTYQDVINDALEQLEREGASIASVKVAPGDAVGNLLITTVIY